jgi:glycine/D-amino acid oxidase-like deaminating enzyme
VKPSSPQLHVAVVGAGAFGGWTALHLLRRGARVTLLDAWGPGNSRASSGGETRVIRGVYGTDDLYTEWAARAVAMWRQAEARWNRPLYRRTGVLWMCGGDDGYVRDSIPRMRDAGLPIAEIGVEEARGTYPQIDFDGVETVFLETEAGYLLARQGCQAVAAAVSDEGGDVRLLAAAPGPFRDGRIERLELSDGSSLQADLYVFACGPWLGSLFPEAIGERFLRVTRQEIFFFGTPPGDARFTDAGCPVWLEMGEPRFYGIPGNEHRGFKVADDTRGEPFDPTSGDRLPSPAALEKARAFLARRFRALADAPVVEARVCQYENSPDGHFLFAPHPQAENVWLLGGGSGHGYKFGPVLGEHAAGVLLGGEAPHDLFRLARPVHPMGETPRSQFEH